MIRAVLFDLDETLLARTASLAPFLAGQHARFEGRTGSGRLGGGRFGGAPFELWRDRSLALDARGHVHKSVVYPALLAEFGGEESAAGALLDDYRERCRHHAKGFPGMASTLIGLRARGLKLGIVTNGETEFQGRHVEALGLGPLVDAVLISQAEGLRKPDAALFLRAAGRLGVERADCLFVGDDPVADILGAHGAGMRTAWFGGGAAWPGDAAPNPGASIDALPELLGLVRADPQA